MIFKKLSWKDADYKIYSENNSIITDEIKIQRKLLEDYIRRHQEFMTSLSPVKLLSDAPEIVRRMHNASILTGLGPMASVAGCIAQISVEAIPVEGCKNAIVENGGDIYLDIDKTVTVGLYAGINSIADKLAFKINRDHLPVAICSSSSKMGHSISFGNCDLVTVFSKDASLADSAATMACNLVKTEDDIEDVLNLTMNIKGISGIMILKDKKIGLQGELPELIRNNDEKTIYKITRHQSISLS
ncbi:MAG: UPF0280 family protein [Spirochaetes bacterium]|nr:UPF0280 family protein [Spirochaetota bacterium]